MVKNTMYSTLVSSGKVLFADFMYIDKCVDAKWSQFHNFLFPVYQPRFPVLSTGFPVDNLMFQVVSTGFPVDNLRFPVVSTRFPVDNLRFPVVSTGFPVGNLGG